jgi:hypothetical protein
MVWYAVGGTAPAWDLDQQPGGGVGGPLRRIAEANSRACVAESTAPHYNMGGRLLDARLAFERTSPHFSSLTQDPDQVARLGDDDRQAAFRIMSDK